MGLKDPDDSSYNLQKENWFKSVRAKVEPAAADFNDNNWATMQMPTPEGWEFREVFLFLLLSTRMEN